MLVDPKIAEHRGRLVKNTGDGLLAEFSSVVEAVRCAVEVQRGMAERNAEVPQDKRIEFRVGINIGDIIEDGGDIFGDGVNVAARLEGIADRGGICISRYVLDHVEGKLDLTFRELGRQNLKNIARPVEVYAINLDAATPTLVVHTRDDRQVPVKLGREIAAGIPGARFVALPGKNHILLEQDPGVAEFFEEVKIFLKDAS
jgi:class 3 adenylate cyclase